MPQPPPFRPDRWQCACVPASASGQRLPRGDDMDTGAAFIRTATRSARLAAVLAVGLLSCLELAGCTGSGTESASRGPTDVSRSESTNDSSTEASSASSSAAPSTPVVTSSATAPSPEPTGEPVNMHGFDWSRFTVPATFCSTEGDVQLHAGNDTNPPSEYLP